MKIYFPGTIIERGEMGAKEFLFGIFAVTKGLMLAQVKEITGLDTPAIQNWINRGFVQKPIEKRYTIDHLARILIINMLRDVMQLEAIAALLTYINGDANDKADDIISESDLFCYICTILDCADYDTVLNHDEFKMIIIKCLENYAEPFAGAREKLINGLEIILLYYASAIVKYKADYAYKQIVTT